MVTDPQQESFKTSTDRNITLTGNAQNWRMRRRFAAVLPASGVCHEFPANANNFYFLRKFCADSLHLLRIRSGVGKVSTSKNFSFLSFPWLHGVCSVRVYRKVFLRFNKGFVISKPGIFNRLNRVSYTVDRYSIK